MMFVLVVVVLLATMFMVMSMFLVMFFMSVLVLMFSERKVIGDKKLIRAAQFQECQLTCDDVSCDVHDGMAKQEAGQLQ